MLQCLLRLARNELTETTSVNNYGEAQECYNTNFRSGRWEIFVSSHKVAVYLKHSTCQALLIASRMVTPSFGNSSPQP